MASLLRRARNARPLGSRFAAGRSRDALMRHQVSHRSRRLDSGRLLISWEILMHEIYMLAVLFNASRRRAVEPTRDQRLRDEQAFYQRHSAGWPRFRC